MLVEASKKSASVWIWASVAAAATGIIAVAVILRLKDKSADNSGAESDRRDLQRILSDCYEKIHEIEERLPAVLSDPGIDSAPRRETRMQIKNGNPITGFN